MLLLAAASLETADHVAAGMKDAPLPYFIGLLGLAVAVLWATLQTVAYWGARGQIEILKERIRELAAEVKTKDDKLDALQAKKDLQSTETIAMVQGMVRIRQALDEEARELGEEAERQGYKLVRGKVAK